LTMIGFLLFDYSGLELKKAISETGNNLKTMFLESALTHFSWGEAIYQVGITVGLAFLATVLGAVISIFLALFAATNLSNEWVSKVIRILVVVIRAVSTVLWVIIFDIAGGYCNKCAIHCGVCT